MTLNLFANGQLSGVITLAPIHLLVFPTDLNSVCQRDDPSESVILQMDFSPTNLDCSWWLQSLSCSSVFLSSAYHQMKQFSTCWRCRLECPATGDITDILSPVPVHAGKVSLTTGTRSCLRKHLKDIKSHCNLVSQLAGRRCYEPLSSGNR